MNREEDMTVLTQLLAEHHPTALEQLYTYAPRLEYALQRRFGAVIDKEDLKDIVRDALIRAWQMGERFDPHAAALTTWLSTLAHYEARSFLRAHSNLIAPTTQAECVDHWASTCAHQQQAEDQQPSAHMQQVLQALPMQQATLVRQHYYEGRPYGELAQLHHIHEVTIKSQLSRARSTLRKRLSARVTA